MRRTAALFALFVLAPAASTARGQTVDGVEFADWTGVTNADIGDDVASGTLLGHSVRLSGPVLSPLPGSVIDGHWPEFNTPAFTPPLPLSDTIEIRVDQSQAETYTLSFGAPVRNPVMHLGSMGSAFRFPGVPLQRLSGDSGLTVSGDTVSGVPLSGPAGLDPNGTVRLPGTFTSLTIVATYPGNLDGIPTQVGAPVPAPTVTPTPTPAPTETPSSLLPPVAGVRVTSARAAGAVSVKLPGSTTFAPLAQAASLPMGTVVDARRGTVSVRAAADAAGHVQSAMVSAGIFVIRQARARAGGLAVPDLVLRTPPGLARACAVGPRKGFVRRLSIVAKGIFRTRPAKGIVTGRNATWTVGDRCTGTLTRVKKGRVAVKAGRRTNNVTAGHSLSIKARLFAAKVHRDR